MTRDSILWRRTDRPGHEAARIAEGPAGWSLAGTAVFAHEGAPCRLDYHVACDPAWRTVSTRVGGWVGNESVEVEIAVDASGRWTVNGSERREVEGCVDVDLNFSPSTNTLPIRRLGLLDAEPGVAHRISVAWVLLPSLEVVQADQIYTKQAEGVVRFANETFSADLVVDDDGFVADYPDLARLAR